MTKKTKIVLSICSVVGLLLLDFVFKGLSGISGWSNPSTGLFSILFDDELSGMIWPIILILTLIVYLFIRKKDHTGLPVIKKTLWIVFIMLGLTSLIFGLFLVFLLVFMS